MSQGLSAPDRSDDFRSLESQLFLAATDLDTCERIVFGAEGWDDVPISTAVRASTALPMVYSPVEVKGRELVDGGTVSPANPDLPAAHGAHAVAGRASPARPRVYARVEVKGRELVGGGIVSTTNLDIAVENGAKFVVV